MKPTPHDIFVAVIGGASAVLLAGMLGRLLWLL